MFKQQPRYDLHLANCTQNFHSFRDVLNTQPGCSLLFFYIYIYFFISNTRSKARQMHSWDNFHLQCKPGRATVWRPYTIYGLIDTVAGWHHVPATFCHDDGSLILERLLSPSSRFCRRRFNLAVKTPITGVTSCSWGEVMMGASP